MKYIFKEREERDIGIEKLNMILMIVGGETIRLNRALNVEQQLMVYKVRLTIYDQDWHV